MSLSTNVRPATIRSVRIEDARAVGDLIVEMLKDSPLAFGENPEEASALTTGQWRELVQELITPDRRAAFLALDEPGACGLVCGDAAFPQAPAGMVVISRLWTAPRQRGTGLGRRLMAEVTRWAIGWHATDLGLGVTEMNIGAIDFYRHLGYADSGFRVPWTADPTKQIIVMQRDLRG